MQYLKCYPQEKREEIVTIFIPDCKTKKQFRKKLDRILGLK